MRILKSLALVTALAIGSSTVAYGRGNTDALAFSDAEAFETALVAEVEQVVEENPVDEEYLLTCARTARAGVLTDLQADQAETQELATVVARMVDDCWAISTTAASLVLVDLEDSLGLQLASGRSRYLDDPGSGMRVVVFGRGSTNALVFGFPHGATPGPAERRVVDEAVMFTSAGTNWTRDDREVIVGAVLAQEPTELPNGLKICFDDDADYRIVDLVLSEAYVCY